jgi:RNA polymerase sigma-70 factor (ECF subfamily)
MEQDTDRREWVLAALDQFERRLLRYCQRLLGNLDEARDVVQFAFLRLCDQSPQSIGDRLPQWLYTVCRNRALDVRRQSGREKANGDHADWAVPTISERSGGQSPPYSAPYSREHDPAATAEQSELHEVLRVLVEALPPAQREALDLWSDGFSYLEISRIMEKQEGHIRVLVHRGLKTLREHPQVRGLMHEVTHSGEPGASAKTMKANEPSPVHGACSR